MMIQLSKLSPNVARTSIPVARNIINILTGTMLPAMSSEVLSRMAEGEAITGIHVSTGEDENFTYEVN